MKKLLIFVLFLGFVSHNMMAQTLIDTKKVPETITKRFDKKYKSAQEVKWYQLGPAHDYMVKCLNQGLILEIKYTADGKEYYSKTEVEIGRLNSKIAEDLKHNHKDKKIQQAFLIEKGRRDKYYSVILHKSQGRKLPPLVYDAQYTFQGQYLTLYEPDLKPIEKKEYKADKYEEEMGEEAEAGDLNNVEYDQSIKKDDLPGPAVSYLKDNFDIEYRYRDIRIKKNKKYGEYYYVVLKKQGDKISYVHYFDTYGELIKVVEEEL